jgi:hypothetical protein
MWEVCQGCRIGNSHESLYDEYKELAIAEIG